MSSPDSPTLCDIVIPVWNQPEKTQRCLESILKQTREPVRLVLIDNGSQPPTRKLLEAFHQESAVPVHLIRNETNLGFIRATNQGIRACQGPWVCLLNNDTLVTAGWLTEMLKAATSDPRIGLVNPTSNSLGFRTQAPIEEYAESLKSLTGQATDLSTALGFCLLARKSMFDEVGLLDEGFGMGNFEDDDLSRRVQAAGYRCVRACAAYVYHEEKTSFRHLPRSEKAFRENRQRFEQRWGRPLRILWALAGPVPKETALQLNAQGHWLCFVAAPETVPAEISNRAQVTFLRTRGPAWRLPAALRLLLKRKKPFHLVISADPVWSRWVRRLRWLHRAEILDAPTEPEILERCRQLARASDA